MITIKLYERFKYLSYWFRYQSIYLEMKYHLKQVLKGKEDNYIKTIYHYDRNIGKSTALARLSAKYNIPVAVPNHKWSIIIEKYIPNSIPKYFKKNKPTTIVINNGLISTQKIHKVLLMEECMSDEQFAIVIGNGHFVGYRNYN